MSAEKDDVMARVTEESPLFMGIFPAGISYSDRREEKDGDYKKLAFLSFLTLRLEVYYKNDLLEQIENDARSIQARRGELFQISTSGQTVRLGG